MSASVQVVTGLLHIDAGLAPDPAAPTGRMRRIRPARARYECLLCLTRIGPVHGKDVAPFVADVRTSHRATCPGQPTQQGATAA